MGFMADVLNARNTVINAEIIAEIIAATISVAISALELIAATISEINKT
jgi:hypothetical protein